MDRTPLNKPTGATSAVNDILAQYGRVTLPTFSEVRAERMRRSLAEFVKEAWHIIEPATPLIWNWHLDAICEHVQALVTGGLSRNNLIINVPPGSMKSTIISVCTPAWIWIRRPSYRAVFSSGNRRVTSRDSVKCRMILESNWYRTTFGIAWKFREDQNEKLSYTNTETGTRVAATVRERIIGERYNGLWCDDPLDAQDANSVAEVTTVNTWWDTSWSNRVADEKTSTRCLIMQRLRENDPTGHLLERESQYWELLRIPQEWEEAQRRTTSLGWSDPRHVEGELMFPERFSAEGLAKEKVTLGQSGYEGQHQQRPSSLAGEIFKRGYAQFIFPGAIPPAAYRQRVISWDTASKVKQENDYSVSLVGDEFDRGVLISSCIRAKMKYPALKETAKLQAQMSLRGVNALLIEDSSAGQQLIPELQTTTSLPIVPCPTGGLDKVAKAWPVVPYWESSRVFFPCDIDGVPEPWVSIFLEELYSFPKAPHDDQVDAFVQLLAYLLRSSGGMALIAYYQSLIKKDKEVTTSMNREDAVFHPIEYISYGGAKR